MAITPSIGTPHPVHGMTLADTLDDILSVLPASAIETLYHLAPAADWDGGVKLRIYVEAMARDRARR